MTKETITKWCKEYLEIESEIARLEGKKKAIKEKLVANVISENMPSKYNLSIKDVPATTIFDGAKFRKDYTDLYNQYRTKNKAGYISLTIKEL